MNPGGLVIVNHGFLIGILRKRSRRGYVGGRVCRFVREIHDLLGQLIRKKVNSNSLPHHAEVHHHLQSGYQLRWFYKARKKAYYQQGTQASERA
jgi:hypothetical protein